MRVTFDHWAFSTQPFGGVARYFAELAHRLQAHGECDVRVLAPLYQSHYLRQLDPRVVTGAYWRPIRRTGRIRQTINDALTRTALRYREPDIIHETYYRAGGMAPAGVKTVLTVYDMIHERLPGYFPPGDPTTARKAAAVRRADRVICISESTRADLLEFHPEAESKAVVIPLASSFDPGACDDAPSIVDGPYLLYVGDRRGYKNFPRLLEAFALAGELLPDVRLVCFGGAPFTVREEEEIERLRLRGRVLRLAGDDGVLGRLYRHATALVYPSLYEGFGMPPLEAMSLGCPVLCSHTSSLPEVVGDAAALFDPADAQSIAAAIIGVATSSERIAELRRRGYARRGEFGWDRCVNETLALYAELAADPRGSVRRR
jgi:glycosyltransferase involved in cell wall biosynthesis